MGFDNECILNIQSLPGEYFCPVCRLLVYPNEALQSQCTHLYCKPCLTYIVSTTQACPYDGYLVTEADSKPLVESNKALAETIGKITVHCLFHRSGCTWQGPLSECTSHCSGCAFGNSPVVCNRCAIQIVHRQVQEHAQHCPGVQPQVSQSEGARNAAAAGVAVTAGQTQVATLARESTTQVQTQTTATPPPVNDPNQQPSSTSQPQALMQGALPNAEQWYQQQLQYQQYYQQYPGYNPYQQHYQQYYPYQQQAVAQYQQVQPQSLSQPQMQQQGQSQPVMQPQARVQPPALSERQLQPSHPPVQAVSAQPQNQAQVNQQQHHGAQAPSYPQAQAPSFPQAQAPSFPQSHALSFPQAQASSFPHSQAPSYPSAHAQLYPQAQPPQPHPIQPHIQQMQMPQYQQTQSQIQHNQPQIHHPVPQPLPQYQSNPQALQTQVQHHPQPQFHPQLRPSLLNRPQVQQTADNAVTSHQPQSHHQIPLTGPPQPPMYVHPQNAAQSLPKNQFPQQTSVMSPKLSHATVSNQMQSLLPSSGQASSVQPTQQLPVRPQAPLPAASVSQLPVMHPVQQPMPHQYVQQPFAGQQQQGPFMQQQLPVQSQLRPQGPQPLLLQHPHAYSQSQQNFALMHGMQPHHPHSLGQPLTPNYGVQNQSYQQAATSVQGMPAQVSANQSSSNQSNLSWATNQVQLASQQQAGTKPEMHVKQEISLKISHERESESSSNKTAKTDNSDAPFVGPAAVVGMKVPKSETDVKPVVDEMKAEIEDKTNAVDTSSKEFSTDFESHALESAEPVNRKIVKEEVVENVEDRRDSANIDIKQEERSMSKEDHDGSLLKTTSMQQGGKFGEQTGEVLKEQKLALPQGAQGPGALPPAGQMQAGGFVQSPSSLSRSSTLHQSPSSPSMVQAPLLGAVHQTQEPTEFRPSMFKPHGVEISPGAIPGSGPLASFGGGAGPQGLYEHGFEPSVALQRSYNLGHPPHFGNPVGGPPIHSGPPSAFNSQGGIVTGPAYGPEGETGQKQPSNLMEAKILSSQRPGYMDGRRSESHFPLEPPSGIQSNMMRMNGVPGLDFRDERFKPFPDERLNPFPMDQARRVIDRGECEKDLKQFQRPSPLDAEPVPKLESHFHSSRSFDRGPRFGMDMGPRSFERGQSYESGFKLDPMGGSAPSRFSPSYQDGAAGRPNSSHAYPDFPRPGSAYGRPHMGGLSPRSVRESIDGREFRRFGDPIGSSIHETRFPVLPGHLRRDEFEGPGRNGDYGQDFLPNHLKMGEPLGPHNLRFGETGGLGGFPGHARMGDLSGPGNFPQPRLGEPGFRSRFSRQGFPSDGGFYTGNLESFDNSRKRKPPTMGWCRICKIDCETVDGLDLHSQTREHQKMALDMVLSIKENAKKQKFDRGSNDDLNKSRNVNFDSHGKKH